jgi:hypothetical protein
MELPLILKELEADYKSELLGERLLATPNIMPLKISEGCNRTVRSAISTCGGMRAGLIRTGWG